MSRDELKKTKVHLQGIHQYFYHKAYGSLNKYANKKNTIKEKDMLANAVVEKYVKNN